MRAKGCQAVWMTVFTRFEILRGGLGIFNLSFPAEGRPPIPHLAEQEEEGCTRHNHSFFLIFHNLTRKMYDFRMTFRALPPLTSAAGATGRLLRATHGTPGPPSPSLPFALSLLPVSYSSMYVKSDYVSVTKRKFIRLVRISAINV